MGVSLVQMAPAAGVNAENAQIVARNSWKMGHKDDNRQLPFGLCEFNYCAELSSGSSVPPPREADLDADGGRVLAV